MENRLLIKSVLVVFVLVCSQVGAISNVEPNVQNAISDEERRGGNDNANSQKKTVLDESGDKKTRGVHSTSASHKHQHYFVPSGYDSHIAATGHGGGSGGPTFTIGSTSGYEYGSHGTGPSAGAGGSSSHGHGHHGPTGYSSTGYGTLGGGYGLVQGQGYGHSGGGGGHPGLGGHSSFGAGGLYGHGGGGGIGLGLGGGHGGGGGIGLGLGGGHAGGFHNALALKGLLIPLAGIALLGAAAALSTNPVLLQLGVVNGRRRRRSAPAATPETRALPYYPVNPYVKPDGN